MSDKSRKTSASIRTYRRKSLPTFICLTRRASADCRLYEQYQEGVVSSDRRRRRVNGTEHDALCAILPQDICESLNFALSYQKKKNWSSFCTYCIGLTGGDRQWAGEIVAGGVLFRLTASMRSLTALCTVTSYLTASMRSLTASCTVAFILAVFEVRILLLYTFE